MNNLKKLFNFTLAHFFTPWSYYLVCTGWWLATVCLCEDGQLTHVEESNRVHQEGGGQVGQVPLHPLHTRHRHICPPSDNRCGGLVFSLPRLPEPDSNLGPGPPHWAARGAADRPVNTVQYK